MNTKVTAILFAAAAAVLIAPIATSSDAEAKRGKGHVTYQTFYTKKATPGYEGFVGAGKYNQYCSYSKKPVRRCKYFGGGQKCKIVAWKLVQFCY